MRLHLTGTWAERKKARREHFEKHVSGNRLVVCTACSGSGHYNHHGSPKCGVCDGRGKHRER